MTACQTPLFIDVPESPRGSIGLDTNAASLMLDATGEVRELVQTALFQEQGLRDIPKYAAILRAIGREKTGFNEIAQSTGLNADPTLRRKLEQLIRLDYVSAERNLGAKAKEAYRYRISDPAFRFYYRFVAPLEIDIGAHLVDGRVLTGTIKWNKKPADLDVHVNHLALLDRLAGSRPSWAHKARNPESPLLYAAASGFTKRFRGTMSAR